MQLATPRAWFSKEYISGRLSLRLCDCDECQKLLYFSRVFRRTACTVFPNCIRTEILWKGLCVKVPTLVMIVDDHAVIRRMLRALLEAESLIVSDAVNGAEGLEKAQAERPDLIILDLSMPVMNGLEAARELHGLMPLIPLLMFTNNAVATVQKEARSAGIAAVICKSDSDALQQLLGHAKSLLGLDGAPVPCAT
jgi:CheY-like chemotaxis protein